MAAIADVKPTSLKDDGVVLPPAVTIIDLPATPSATSLMKSAKFRDEFKAGELQLPWLRIVQTASGYMKRASDEYIEQAREGDIIDNVSKRLRASQAVILVKYETHYTEWAPGGGKLVRQWFMDPTGYNAAHFPEGKSFGKKITEARNEIAQTPTYYILAIDTETGSAQPMCMAWGSTQAKKTRTMNTIARSEVIDEAGLPFIPPIYARIFELGSRGEVGDDGKSWAGWTFKPVGLVAAHPKFGARWWAAAEAFREQIEKGNVRPGLPDDVEEGVAQQDEPATYGDGMPSAGSKLPSDDIPF